MEIFNRQERIWNRPKNHTLRCLFPHPNFTEKAQVKKEFDSSNFLSTTSNVYNKNRSLFYGQKTMPLKGENEA